MMGYVKDAFRVAGAPIDFEMVALDPSTDNYDDLYNVRNKYESNRFQTKMQPLKSESRAKI